MIERRRRSPVANADRRLPTLWPLTILHSQGIQKYGLRFVNMANKKDKKQNICHSMKSKEAYRLKWYINAMGQTFETRLPVALCKNVQILYIYAALN